MARGRRRSVGLAAAVLSVLVSGCSSDAPSAPSARSTAPSIEPTASGSEAVDGLVFGECGDLLDMSTVQMPEDRVGHLTFECGTLDVPLDHDDPAGEPIGLAVVRIHDDRQTSRIGTLVMGAGGPGQSGLGLAPYWASWVSDDIFARFDVVTLDPRGVGASAGFNCPPTPRDDEPAKMADLLSSEGWAFAMEVHRAGSASCLEELGPDRAGRFGTVAAARDLDLLREAVGDEQLTFVGFSYGAKLGAEYARQFPDRVRALVLDGPSHPVDGPIGIVERQVAAFEESLAAWADDCPARPTCTRIGDDPVGFVRGLMDRARQMPIPSGRPLDDPPASDGDVISGLAALLRFQQFWPQLDDALAEMALGDSGTLREAIEQGFGGGDDAPYDERDANLVINCTDARPGPAKAAILRSARRLMDTYPVFGMAGAWWLVGCKYWAGPRTVLPVPEDVGAAPIVVVGTRHDPATPYSGAVAMARILGSGHLLTWDGYTHTAYGQTDCITKAVDAYLLDLVVPPTGTVCPAGG